MLGRIICQILGRYLTYLTIALCFPLLLALYDQYIAFEAHLQPFATGGIVAATVVSLVASITLSSIGRSAKGTLLRREAILLVVLIWFATAFVSALPFYFSNTLRSFSDAYFEAMSGLTTTGASMLSAKAYNPETGDEVMVHVTNPHVPDKTYVYWGTVPPVRDRHNGLILYSGIEAVSRSLLLWRSLLQWMGGMGIVVIFLAVLPVLGVGGKFLYQMEATGPIKDEISPRVQDTASRLWKLYLGLTIAEMCLLVMTNASMPWFDAVCIALSNISTGGFSVRNDSIASYHSQATEWVVLLFMLFGSINFSLYFQVAKMKLFKAFAPDFWLFLAIAATGAIVVSLFLVGQDQHSWGEAFRQGSFQALSMQTSTGFVTANYDRWPFTAQMFMLLLMFVGGMSGSTAGGIKISRFYILYKIVLNRLESLYRPDSVRKLRIGSAEVDDKNALTVLAFFCIVAFFVIIGTASLVLDGIDPETSLGLAASLLNNVGVAFRAAGPTDSLCFLPTLSKWLATIWMLLGRLEYYVVLLVLLPQFWRNE
ncbi:MAG: hypothetical protein RL235_678 [Chlamydiota bacterium]|jgi:trk system potassium uptake protein TrkH